MDSQSPKLIAHRRDTLSFPENTIESFKSAFEKGSDGVELDIHLYDGEIIVVHDYLFDHKKSHPRLKDVLELFNAQGRIEIEIKEFNTDILKPLKQLLDKFLQADIELTTSEIPLAIHIKNLFHNTPTGLIFHDSLFQDWMTNEIAIKKIIGWGKMTKSDRLHIPFKVLNQFGKGLLVESLHNVGFVVHSHIYNTEQQRKEFSYLSQWKVDQCTFDSMELLKG